MSARKRQGNRPDRRIQPEGPLPEDVAAGLIARCRYEGAAFHKLRGGDYGLQPGSSPRPHKSLCDDIRKLAKAEAEALFTQGIKQGLVSAFASGSVPKYVWAVDEDGEVYEAKTKPGQAAIASYHGYRLGHNDPFRHYVLKAWKPR